MNKVETFLIMGKSSRGTTDLAHKKQQKNTMVSNTIINVRLILCDECQAFPVIFFREISPRFHPIP